ncbi:hypothetical protein TRIATDRAFT_86883 [Trichoderma atroviride IMI 206040]|uniref:Uncharacterized protein n=2 Tax=Hypocrea atroviridis TaxID=63577 RepID=G9NZ74_HYPAI|nr:uncharacterized protein TRIATDRAFT_86883 [Trichoderma atroviride IMI 206040]EHK43789.1 hypothetical protein TRIATDRAFT_86883 [Trichoderma atroviride IMI 206040]
MQFKTLFFAAALMAQSAFAMSSTQQGQVKPNEKNVQSEQSAQIHQLENLAHTMQSQRAQDSILLIGAPPLNASTIVTTIAAINAALGTTDALISAVTNATIVQNLPNIINNLGNLTNTIVADVSPIVSSPVIGVYSPIDQAAMITALSQLVDTNTDLINDFIGPLGLFSNSLYRGPIGVVLNLIERSIVDLAGAVVARVPAFAEEARPLLSNLHFSLAQTINF